MATLVNSRPDGWPVLPTDTRIDRLLRPVEREFLERLIAVTGGSFRYVDEGRTLEMSVQPHASFSDEHLMAGQPVRVSYLLKSRIWRSTIGTWMWRGLPGLLRHLARMRAPDGDADMSRKLYAALGVAVSGLLVESADEPADTPVSG